MHFPREAKCIFTVSQTQANRIIKPSRILLKIQGHTSKLTLKGGYPILKNKILG